jgi:hypothetical protein
MAAAIATARTDAVPIMKGISSTGQPRITTPTSIRQPDHRIDAEQQQTAQKKRVDASSAPSDDFGSGQVTSKLLAHHGPSSASVTTPAALSRDLFRR